MNGFPMDVFSTLVVTAVAGLITWLVARTREAVVTRRFPVSGTYASVYEDQVNGVRVTTKAVVVLKQRGRRIWGGTKNMGDKRGWKLEGRVASHGRIYGTYESEDPYDEGLGGFFLKKGSAGQLEGMWAGYDSTNQSIEAGRYSFWPLSPVEVQDMRETDLSEALAVLGEALGQRYIARDELREYVTDPAKRCAYVAKQSDRGTVGAAIGLLLDAESFFQSIPADQVAEVERMFPGLEFQSLGWLKSMAVSDGMAGQGIGTQLTRAVLRRLSDLGATYVVAIGWTDVKGCHIEGILRSLGFSKVGQLESFWERDSIEHDHECPTCGQPCRCIATFFAVRKPNLVRL